MTLKYINGVQGAPQAVGPYSQAVVFENVAYLSGQIPLNPETGNIVEGDIETQTEQVMKNLIAVLGHMGLDFSHVVKSTIYLTDMNDFQRVNNIYAKWLGVYRPARVTIQVAGLPKGADVEIDMLAAIARDARLTTEHEGANDLNELTGEGFCCQKS